jgi:hypothetical protein
LNEASDVQPRTVAIIDTVVLIPSRSAISTADLACMGSRSLSMIRCMRLEPLSTPKKTPSQPARAISSRSSSSEGGESS